MSNLVYKILYALVFLTPIIKAATILYALVFLTPIIKAATILYALVFLTPIIKAATILYALVFLTPIIKAATILYALVFLTPIIKAATILYALVFLTPIIKAATILYALVFLTPIIKAATILYALVFLTPIIKAATILYALVFLTPIIKAATIVVVVPTPSISHQVVFRPFTQELAKRGHEVIVWTTDPAFPPGKAPQNLTELDFHEESYELWKKTFVTNVDSGTNSLRTIVIGVEVMNDIFEMQFKKKEVQNIVKNKKIDLLMVEAWFRLPLFISQVFKGVPVVQISSFGDFKPNYKVIGAPTNPWLYPTVLMKKLYNLTAFEKLKAVLYDYEIYRQINNEENINALLKKYFGADAPTITELEDNIDMLFLNVHPVWEGNRPVPPGVVYMGGLLTRPPSDLPQDIQTYLDSSPQGVIYMSLGTNANPSALPSHSIQAILAVLSRLPYNVYLKWDQNELPNKPKNVKIFKWCPQYDLLRHKNVRLFITQGGLQSTDDAINAGVPLIGLPLLGDQWYNTDKYVYHKIGIKLDVNTLTEEIFEEAVTTILNDPSYYRSIAKLKELMQDQPQTPLERVVWWTEYVIRHKGAKHLRSPAANLHWTQ